jgi:hypothetical protein
VSIELKDTRDARLMLPCRFQVPRANSPFAPRPFISSVTSAMKITKERKVYGAVLVLAVAALGADKMFSGPSVARGSASMGQTAASPHKVIIAADKSVPTGHSNLVGLAALADRMQEVNRAERLELEKVEDIFHAPATWTKPPPKAAAVPAVDPTVTFTSNHHLIALLKGSRGGVAVLDGAGHRSLRIGQSVDGFRLMRIGERSATFTSAQGTAELTLPAEANADALSISPAAR